MLTCIPSLTTPSVDAVQSSPAAPWQKLTALVGWSWAERRYRGADCAPMRASNAATIPSSAAATKDVGLAGDQAIASRSACMLQVSPCCCVCRTSACSQSEAFVLTTAPGSCRLGHLLDKAQFPIEHGVSLCLACQCEVEDLVAWRKHSALRCPRSLVCAAVQQVTHQVQLMVEAPR